jgi:predicted metalloprotease with PDZ domain
MGLLAWLWLLGVDALHPTMAPAELPVISYLVMPIPQEDRTLLEVELSFVGGETGRTVLRLPHGSNGVRNLEDSVVDVEVEAPAELRPGDVEWRKIVEHEPGEEVTVHYLMAWNPTLPLTSSYRPLVHADYFQFFSEHWMVRPIADDVPAVWRFECLDAPEDWQFFGSFGVGVDGGSVEGSWKEIEESFVAGGAVRQKTLDLPGGAVNVLLHGSLGCPDQDLFRALQAIVSQQRGLLKGPMPASFVVCISEIPESAVAGVSLLDSFVCRVHPDRDCTTINELLAHELFHQWIPGQGTVKGDFKSEYQWFSEGLADYFARRFLVDGGLMTVEGFVARTNQDLLEYEDNPQRSVNREQMRRARAGDGFTPEHYRLCYLRGFFLALRWEALLRRQQLPPLCSVIAEFLEQCREGGGTLTEEEFFQLFAARGVKTIREDVTRFIDRGERLPVEEDSFGPDWTLGVSPQRPEVLQFVPASGR